MTKFTISDINPVSYEELGEFMDVLSSKIETYFRDKDEKIDIIVPLLRTGGITGGILSIRLRVLNVLPVQFKYFYNPTTIKQILSLPEILTEIPESPNILLTEGNTSSGSIAKEAAKLLKQKYPNSKIYHATVSKVYGGPEKLDNIEEIFYSVLTNENFKADEKEIAELHIRKGITIFPWENAEDELRDINSI